MNASFLTASLFPPRLVSTSFHGQTRSSASSLWFNARFRAAPHCGRPALSVFWANSALLAATRPEGCTVTNGSTKSVLQFAHGNIWNATHRSRVSRPASLAARPNPYSARDPRRPPNQSSWQRFRQWLDALPNNVIFWGIIVLNGLVYAAWNVAIAKYKSTGDPNMYLWMRNNFTVSMQNVSAGRLWTLLTSCVSHEGAAHVAVNAFTFYFMAPAVMSMLGNFAFLSLYLGGGLAASVGSLWWHHAVKGKGGQYASHGASGAIYAVISFLACIMPKSQFYLFAVVPVPAWAFVSGIFLWDGYSALHDQRAGTDTAGHVGGLLAGIAYYLRLRFRLF